MGNKNRYPMTSDQPCQIDCRKRDCIFNGGGGRCNNVSPAITLCENGGFVCWSKEKEDRDFRARKFYQEYKKLVQKYDIIAAEDDSPSEWIKVDGKEFNYYDIRGDRENE